MKSKMCVGTLLAIVSVFFSIPAGAQFSAQPSTNLPSGMPTETRRPVNINGEVVLQDGTPLAEPVEIQRVCGNVVRRETSSDAKGKFSIVITEDSGIGYQEASEGGNAATMGAQIGGYTSQTTRTQLWGCEIRAVLPGYRSGSVSLAGRDFSLPVNIGKITLSPNTSSAGLSVSASDLKATSNARKEFEKGREAYFKKKYDDAEKHLNNAIKEFPGYVSALDLRGRVQRALKQDSLAEESFVAAVAADTKFMPAYLHLGALYSSQAKWHEAIEISNRAIAIDSENYAEPFYFDAMAYLMLNDLKQAQSYAERVIEMDKEHRFPRAELVLGNVFRARGNRVRAAEHLRNYLKYVPNGPEAANIRASAEELEKEGAPGEQAGQVPPKKP